jgi:hypothetical protein
MAQFSLDTMKDFSKQAKTQSKQSKELIRRFPVHELVGGTLNTEWLSESFEVYLVCSNLSCTRRVRPFVQDRTLKAIKSPLSRPDDMRSLQQPKPWRHSSHINSKSEAPRAASCLSSASINPSKQHAIWYGLAECARNPAYLKTQPSSIHVMNNTPSPCRTKV